MGKKSNKHKKSHSKESLVQKKGTNSENSGKSGTVEDTESLRRLSLRMVETLPQPLDLNQPLLTLSSESVNLQQSLLSPRKQRKLQKQLQLAQSSPTKLSKKSNRQMMSARTIQGGTTLAEPDSTTREIFGAHAYGNASGQILNENVAQNISTFYACVTLRAQTLATMPIVCYRKSSDPSKAYDRDIADQHPANWIWNHSPDDYITSFNAREASQGHVDIRGNAYYEIGRNYRGQAIKVWLLDPRRMTIQFPLGYDEAYTAQRQPNADIYHYDMMGPSPQHFDRSEIMHVANWSYDGLNGLAPLTIFRETLGLTIAANRYTAEFFRKGGAPLGFLTKPNVLTKIQRDSLRSEWNELHGGVENAHNIGILSGGLDWKSIAPSNHDTQLLGLRSFQRWLVAEIMRTPLGLIGNPEAKADLSIEPLMIHFIIFTMLPLMKRWEGEMNMKMFTPKEQYYYTLEYDPTIFLRGDQKTMADVDQTLIRNGIMQVDEVRHARKLNSVPYGSTPLVMASQMATLENVVKGTANLDTTNGGKTKNTAPGSKTAGDPPSTEKAMNRIRMAYKRLNERDREKVKGMLAMMNGQGT